MASEREFQETVARCVSMMVYYRNDLRSAAAAAAMTDEIHGVARQIATLGPIAADWSRDLRRRVQEELVARYGRPIGGCLHDEFLGAFEGAARRQGALQRSDGVPQP